MHIVKLNLVFLGGQNWFSHRGSEAINWRGEKIGTFYSQCYWMHRSLNLTFPLSPSLCLPLYCPFSSLQWYDRGPGTPACLSYLLSPAASWWGEAFWEKDLVWAEPGEGAYCRTGGPGLEYMFKDQHLRLKERLDTFSCGRAAICAGIWLLIVKSN